MYSNELQYLLLKNVSIQVDNVIIYLEDQLQKPNKEREVSYLWQLLIQPENKNILDEYLLLHDSIDIEELSYSPKIATLETECPISLENICVEDAIGYYTNSGYFNYLNNISTLEQLESFVCPVTKCPIKWIIKLSDLNHEQLDYLKLEGTKKLKTPQTRQQRHELEQWAAKAPTFTIPEDDVMAHFKSWIYQYKILVINTLTQKPLFYQLCNSAHGQQILAKLPHTTLEQIPNTLWHFINTTDHKYLGETALYNLCSITDELTLLQQQKNAFFLKLDPQLWAIPITAERHDYGRTAFNWLCVEAAGHELLKRLPEAFFMQLPKHIWALAETSKTAFEGKTPLHNLCYAESGLEIINSWSAKCIEAIPLDAWSTIAADGETPLSLLRGALSGEEILTKHANYFAPLESRSTTPTLFQSQTIPSQTKRTKCCCALQ